MQTSVAQLVREHFRQQAKSFDSLYDAGVDSDNAVQRFLRADMFRRAELAVQEVRNRPSPRVLDVGCGSGRVAEELLKAGAGSYVGVDFSEPMVELSKSRLAQFGDAVTLQVGDFLEAELEGPFDVSVAIGFFDYIGDPVPFVQKLYGLTTGVVVASFPRWDWVKGPVRKLRYEMVNDCPIYNFTERELDFLFRGAGFSSTSFVKSRSGLILRAYR